MINAANVWQNLVDFINIITGSKSITIIFSRQFLQHGAPASPIFYDVNFVNHAMSKKCLTHDQSPAEPRRNNPKNSKTAVNQPPAKRNFSKLTLY
jgi:hypothetical protein